MIDLTTVPADVLHARGCYATVRAEHEEQKLRLSKLCGELAAISAQVLRLMQPANGEVPQNVNALLRAGRQAIDMIEGCTAQIESLAQQRHDLKAKAWK